jgi:hypothetical protein
MLDFYFFTDATVFNVAMTARRVSKRQYGWATAFAFSALWSMVFVALAAIAKATGEAA